MSDSKKAIETLRSCHSWDYEDEWALDIAIEALEKQIPKKPLIQTTDEKTHYKCQCGSINLTVYKRDGLHMGHKAKFCEWCGQAISWEVEE